MTRTDSVITARDPWMRVLDDCAREVPASERKDLGCPSGYRGTKTETVSWIQIEHASAVPAKADYRKPGSESASTADHCRRKGGGGGGGGGGGDSGVRWGHWDEKTRKHCSEPFEGSRLDTDVNNVEPGIPDRFENDDDDDEEDG